jgi:hypothetical protein
MVMSLQGEQQDLRCWFEMEVNKVNTEEQEIGGVFVATQLYTDKGSKVPRRSSPRESSTDVLIKVFYSRGKVETVHRSSRGDITSAEATILSLGENPFLEALHQNL